MYANGNWFNLTDAVSERIWAAEKLLKAYKQN